MTANETPDTINVELPIEARDGGYVSVGSLVLPRGYWREVATDLALASVIVRAVAPAVVAWMERDEWKPLDVPEVGRTIKATLRDGRVETFEVGVTETGHYSEWAGVWKIGSSGEVHYIQRVRDVVDAGPGDIIAWEYVDEADPINVPADGSMISATFGDGSVRVIAVRWAASIGKIAGVIQSSITQYRVGEWADDHADPQRDITSWKYVDEPDADLAAIADKIAAAVNELREAIG